MTLVTIATVEIYRFIIVCNTFIKVLARYFFVQSVLQSVKERGRN